MLMGRGRSLCSAAYKVDVLPDPVGPVTKSSPWGRSLKASKSFCTKGGIPICSRSCTAGVRRRRRITTFSPRCVGKVETRMSMGSSPWW